MPDGSQHSESCQHCPTAIDGPMLHDACLVRHRLVSLGPLSRPPCRYFRLLSMRILVDWKNVQVRGHSLRRRCVCWLSQQFIQTLMSHFLNAGMLLPKAKSSSGTPGGPRALHASVPATQWSVGLRLLPWLSACPQVTPCTDTVGGSIPPPNRRAFSAWAYALSCLVVLRYRTSLKLFRLRYPWCSPGRRPFSTTSSAPGP